MQRLRPIPFVHRLIILFVLVPTLTACANMAQKTATQPGEPEPVAGPQLNGELLYQLLAAEFYGVRGQFDESADYYLEAAEHTDDPRVAERAAHIAVYSGQHDKALRAIRRWETLGAEGPTLARLKALVHINRENTEEALAAIEPLLLVDGQVDDDAVGALGHILQKEARPAFALTLLERLNQRYPEEMRLLLLQGRIESDAGHYDEAMETIEHVIRLAPDTSDAYLIKAQILAGQDHHDEAVEAVAMAVDKRPDDNRLRMQYARMLVQMEKYDQAWDQFMELHRVLPDDENVLLSLGLLSIETGKNDLAKQYLQELIDAGYHNAKAHYYLGRIQQSDREIMAAIANYSRVHEGEFLLDARIREAGLLAHIGKVDEALQKLEQLSQADPSSDHQVRVYLARGEVLRRADRNREAMTLYNSALEEMPENIDLLYARALTAEKLDMLDVAEADLRMVLTHEPDNANALNALGYTLADRTERLQEAKKYILRAAELLPDDPAVLDSLGWVYYRMGEMDKAIEWLQKAFEKLPDAEIAAHLGEVLWKTGRLEEARQVWQRGLEVKPDHPVLLDTMNRLD